MSNVTVQRLGDEAQLDNDPHRLDYVRRDQGRLDPALHTVRLGYWEIAALGIVFVPSWLIVLLTLWAVYGIQSWGVPEYDRPRALYIVAHLWTYLPAIAAVLLLSVFVWRWVVRTGAEVLRARITRDRYSNPIDAQAVINKTAAENWHELWLATQAEVAMAPFKQLPAGLDSFSTSNSTQLAKPDAPALPDNEQTMPFDAFWRVLTEEVVHLKAIGPSKSGKSTLCQALLNHIVASERDQVVVLSPVGAADDWSVPVIGLTDINKIPEALSLLIEEGDRRQTLLAVSTRAQFDREHNHIWIFVDETPEVAQNTATKAKWVEFFSRFGSRARHMHMHVVVMAQTETTVSLGTKGNAAIKENLTTVYTKHVAGQHIVEIVHGEDDTTREPLTWRVQDVYRLRELAHDAPALRQDAVFLTENHIDNAFLFTLLSENPLPAPHFDAAKKQSKVQSDARAAEIRARRSAGQTYKQIEEEMGISSATIAKAVAESNSE
jgi:hypothetical protein